MIGERPRRLRRLAILACAVTLLATAAAGGPLASAAGAVTLTVNTTSDAAPGASECEGAPGDCSLRQAVDKAAPGDTISLPASATAYSVMLGVITIDKAITISGGGARTTKIDANGTSQIFDVSGLPSSSTLTISAVTISGGDQSGSSPSDGSGGAIDVNSAGATVDLSGVALSDNTASVAGGAIELSAGNMDITDSTLGPDNVASGNSDFPGTGGAIDNDNGTLSISDSTISGNTAGVADVAPGGRGGAISDESSGITGTTMLQYDTIAYNTATGTGATGGNLYTITNDPDGFTIADTIVADGAAPTGGDCYSDGDFVSEGYNLTDGIASTGVAACGFTHSTDVLGDARLGPLTNNGGPTDTEALAAGSPAIDQIPTSSTGCPGTDQRGDARPKASGCDIGALEAGYGETAPQWSVAHDFQTSPLENPSPDSLGNSDVWSYEQGPLADLGVPADYTLLPDSSTDAGACSNLDSWNVGGGLPVVDFDAEAATIACGTVTVPAQTVVMHPSGSDYSIVAWKSPVTADITVAGSFVSMDPNGGSGTTWDVDNGANNLASGTNAVGGSGSFDLSSLSVTSGDTLYFILGPTGAAQYETTELNLTITEAGAPPPPSADLALTVSRPESVSPGATVTDTFTVTNNGPDTSAGVTFVDTLPTAAAYQSASASQGNCFPPSSGMLSCSLGSLADGDQATVSVTLLTQSDFTGPLSNTADVSAATNDPNPANNSATATTTVSPPCPTSMTLDSVEVLAGCIASQGNGTYLASGDARFANGASIVDAGTQTPAALVIDPSSHQISIAPAAGGGAQSGELEAGGVDVATGDLVVHTQGETDPISGLAGSASVTGVSSVGVSLSGWNFADSDVPPTVYLAPSSDGGGATVDGQLTLPAWLGDALAFGPLEATGVVPGASGQIAVQVPSSGQLSVINGGISFKASVLGDPSVQLANAELTYQRAGDEWTGSANLGFASLVDLKVNGVISDGKLDNLSADFACSTSKICGTGGSLPTLGAILDIKDVDLSMINLQGINYTPPPELSASLGTGAFHLPIACFTNRFVKCPPPQPAPQVDGAVIVGVLGDRVIAGGNFDYLLDGQFTASGAVGLAPLYGSKFSDPGPLAPGQSAQNAVANLLSTGFAGVELAGATIDYTPPGLLQATGTVFLPPPPFPFQFLKGTISIGIDASHFTGEGSLNLVIPNYVPLIHGDTFGGVQALISDEAAAAEASLPQYCASVDLGFHTYTECTPKITFLAAFDWTTGKVTVDMNGGSINDYATVSQLIASDAAVGGSRFVHVPARKQLASFTVHSARRTPDVELIGPPVAGHRRHLMLRTSKKLRNHTGALAWLDKKAHTESFLVLAPSGGRWTVKRLGGARITAVKVVVPRKKLKAKVYPHAVERAGDLPKGTVSTAGKLTLHYRVPTAGRGTTVDLWAGTGPHGAGGTMIADGLRPSGAATWKLSGLASGRYYPYAIVSHNGIPVSIHYWPGSVEVVNSAAPAAPTGVQAAPEAGQVYVAWNGVQGAATYAVTATRSDGGSPVRDAVPASQVDDALTLAPGTWSITVQSVAAGDQASLPSAPTTVTVP